MVLANSSIVPFHDLDLQLHKGLGMIHVHCILSVTVVSSNLTGLGFVFIIPQGSKYWRFDGDVLDENYPRNISVGFDGIPDDVDAAFAIPASSYRGIEKAYFFKGICVGVCDVFQYLKAPLAQCRLGQRSSGFSSFWLAAL